MSWYNWVKTNSNLLKESQLLVLNAAVEHANLSEPKVEIRVKSVETELEGEHFNVLECRRKDNVVEEHTATLVMMPGYGGSSVMFANNLVGFAKTLPPQVRLLAVDWIGTGVSSRPKFEAKNLEEAEAFFVDSFERYRKAEGLNDNIILLAHSLGGYLASAYVLKHDSEHGRVKHLILASPVGMPETPPPDPEQKMPFIFKAFRKMWDWGITPHGFVRTSGPFGKGIVKKLIEKRFGENMGHIGLYGLENKPELVSSFLYHSLSQPPSGDQALSKILKPGAWAYSPMVNRLPALTSTPTVSFLYGSHDWMSPQAAQVLKKKMKANVSVGIIPQAGHHLYVNNTPAFNEAVSNMILSTVNSLSGGVKLSEIMPNL